MLCYTMKAHTYRCIGWIIGLLPTVLSTMCNGAINLILRRCCGLLLEDKHYYTSLSYSREAWSFAWVINNNRFYISSSIYYIPPTLLGSRELYRSIAILPDLSDRQQQQFGISTSWSICHTYKKLPSNLLPFLLPRLLNVFSPDWELL